MPTPDLNHQTTVTNNLLLALLPTAELAALRPDLTVVAIAAGDTIHAADTPIHSVYFPLTGCSSVVATDAEGDMLEVGTIGREGLVGIAAFLDSDSGPLATICQISGDFVRLPTSTLHAVATPGTVFYRLLQRFTQASHILATQCTACNRFHEMQERCARWLLLSHDRMGQDSFNLTHEFLGYMLGVRRPGVTVAMGGLQRAGLITYQRGEVTILDRDGLENSACECYDVITTAYSRLLGRYPKGTQAV